MPKIECVNSHKGEVHIIEEIRDSDDANGSTTKYFFVVICLRCGEELNRIDP